LGLDLPLRKIQGVCGRVPCVRFDVVPITLRVPFLFDKSNVALESLWWSLMSQPL
jgi:hypothetical protein